MALSNRKGKTWVEQSTSPGATSPTIRYSWKVPDQIMLLHYIESGSQMTYELDKSTGKITQMVDGKPGPVMFTFSIEDGMLVRFVDMERLQHRYKTQIGQDGVPFTTQEIRFAKEPNFSAPKVTTTYILSDSAAAAAKIDADKSAERARRRSLPALTPAAIDRVFGPLDEMVGSDWTKLNYADTTISQEQVTFEWDVPGKVLVQRSGSDTSLRWELDPSGTHIVSGNSHSAPEGNAFYLDRVYDDWTARTYWQERGDGVVDVLQAEKRGGAAFNEPHLLYRYVPVGMTAPIDAKFGGELADPSAWGDFARFANGVYGLSGVRPGPDGRSLRFYKFKDGGEIDHFAVLRHEGGNRFAMLGPAWDLFERLIGKGHTIILSIDESVTRYPRLKIDQTMTGVTIPYGFVAGWREPLNDDLVVFADRFDRDNAAIEDWFSPSTASAYRAELDRMERSAEIERENMRIGDEMAAEQRARNAGMLTTLPGAVAQVARDNAQMEAQLQGSINRGLAQGGQQSISYSGIEVQEAETAPAPALATAATPAPFPAAPKTLYWRCMAAKGGTPTIYSSTFGVPMDSRWHVMTLRSAYGQFLRGRGSGFLRDVSCSSATTMAEAETLSSFNTTGQNVETVELPVWFWQANGRSGPSTSALITDTKLLLSRFSKWICMLRERTAYLVFENTSLAACIPFSSPPDSTIATHASASVLACLKTS